MEKFSIITHEERENYSDTKLPLLAAKISKMGIDAGISPEFLPKETSRLMDAIEKFIKALQSRGL